MFHRHLAHQMMPGVDRREELIIVPILMARVPKAWKTSHAHDHLPTSLTPETVPRPHANSRIRLRPEYRLAQTLQPLAVFARLQAHVRLIGWEQAKEGEWGAAVKETCMCLVDRILHCITPIPFPQFDHWNDDRIGVEKLGRHVFFHRRRGEIANVNPDDSAALLDRIALHSDAGLAAD